jgi:leucine-rich repeat-containing G protein-coupled receptor 8
MSNLVLRICVWVLGVLATFGNILVIGWRIRFKHTNQVTEHLLKELKRLQLGYTNKLKESAS